MLSKVAYCVVNSFCVECAFLLLLVCFVLDILLGTLHLLYYLLPVSLFVEWYFPFILLVSLIANVDFCKDYVMI